MATSTETKIAVFVGYAHPIGEDAQTFWTFWTSVGRTKEEARAKLHAAVLDAWDVSFDNDPNGNWVVAVDEHEV